MGLILCWVHWHFLCGVPFVVFLFSTWVFPVVWAFFFFFNPRYQNFEYVGENVSVITELWFWITGYWLSVFILWLVQPASRWMFLSLWTGLWAYGCCNICGQVCGHTRGCLPLGHICIGNLKGDMVLRQALLNTDVATSVDRSAGVGNVVTSVGL